MVKPLGKTGVGLKRLVTREAIHSRRAAAAAKPTLFFNRWQTIAIAVSFVVCVLEILNGTTTAAFGVLHPTLTYIACSLMGLGSAMIFLRASVGARLVETGSWMLIAATTLPLLAVLNGSDPVGIVVASLPAAFVEFCFAIALPIVSLYCVTHPRWGEAA